MYNAHLEAPTEKNLTFLSEMRYFMKVADPDIDHK